MEEDKSKLSFAGIAVGFFVLIVFPLTITGFIISQGVVKVGQEATQANLRVLDETQKSAVAGRAENLAEAVAQFFMEREKDVRIASILPRSEDAYQTFLSSNTRGVVRASNIGVVRVPVPIYREVTFIDRHGQEVLKVTKAGAAQELRDLSNPQNAEFGHEDYFVRARGLNPGEVYMGPVVGYHVDKAGFSSGKRFDGQIRLASPVFDSSGFAGVVALSLNFVHLMEFTDHIVPTEEGKIFAEVGAADTNYAFMVAADGSILSHPHDYLIGGLDDAGRPVPTITAENYQDLMPGGQGAMNLNSQRDQNLAQIHSLALTGKTGSETYNLGDQRLFVAYAPIPYYGGSIARPQGFGWIGMVVDIDQYHNLSQAKVEEIQLKIERWQKSSITVVIVSLILIFAIALILARGVYRQVSAPPPPPRDDLLDEV